jgi:HSP20 family molecular chaperone IbpA
MSLLDVLTPSRVRGSATHDHNRASDFAGTIRPRYEFKETAEAWGLTVHLPGVSREGLELTAEEGQLRIVGRRAWKQPEGWTALYRETADLPYELVLTHDNAVNVDAIAAEVRDGVLRVSLPKHEALKPRRIAVK